METFFLCIVAFLIILAVFDLVVGVSNDAVNFLNSAIGARVAKFRTVVLIAAIGVFAGAALSNGMMDVARHGIMTPQWYTFYEVMCVFLAVMATDVVLLDVFNTLGMPTSTTVSMVFELLGGTFALALLKIARGEMSADGTLLSLGDLLNTEKALSVILGIFLSVGIAFVVGTLVMWVARMVFSFAYRVNGTTTDATGRMGSLTGSSLKIGVFSGLCVTGIVWFLLVNGLKGTSLMTPELKATIADNTWLILGSMALGASVVMTALSALKLPVLKGVVLLGTFALAMAFAGNDLVNFVGVPLTGLASYQDYMANGAGNANGFLMTSLMGPAQTPAVFLLLAGVVMVLSLVFSKKAQNVVKTSVDLSRQDEGDEMFGSSAAARTLVRASRHTAQAITRFIPAGVGRWVDSRFQAESAVLPKGAAFDLVRASVNLVLAGLLVAIGTAQKLPLSTTYVTFMVAMGSSLADRAWSRESAVFRITGVLSVIGGWFITAAVAFILCYLVCTALYFGGAVAMTLAVVVAVALLVRSNLRYAKRAAGSESDVLFESLIHSRDKAERWDLLRQHVRQSTRVFLDYAAETLSVATDAFFADKYYDLRRATRGVKEEREEHKRQRRRELIGLRRVDTVLATSRNTWFFRATNSTEQMLYALQRMAEPCLEHVANSFPTVPAAYAAPYKALRGEAVEMFRRASRMMEAGVLDDADGIRTDAAALQTRLAAFRKTVLDDMQTQTQATATGSTTLMLNILQETEELLSALRHCVRGVRMFAA